jgi:tetratricopeptide (TPR) repeat protein
MKIMKRFLSTITALALGVPLLARAQGPDSQFIQIYKLIQQADVSVETGQPRIAREGYLEAQKALQQLQASSPGWNEKVVKFRLNYLAEKLVSLEAQFPAIATTPPGAAEKKPTTPGVSGELEALDRQIRQLQSDKQFLEAKLREALSAQPAALDPRELKKADAQIRMLEKENSLLKAGLLREELKASNAVDSPALEQMKKALAEANLKLQQQLVATTALELEKKALETRVQSLTGRPQPPVSEESATRAPTLSFVQAPAERETSLAEASWRAQEQTERIKALTLENQTLQKKLENVSVTSQLSRLEAENEQLKKELDAAKQTQQSAPRNELLASELSYAKTELEAQRAANETLRSEKTALERRLKQMNAKRAATLSPRVESQVSQAGQKRSPTEPAERESLKQLEKEKKEREELQKKLEAAKAELAKSQNTGKDSQSKRSSKEVERLTARLAVLEAHKVPYTPEELALFNPPRPITAPAQNAPIEPKAQTTIQLVQNSTPAPPPPAQKPAETTPATDAPATNGSKPEKKSLRDLPAGAGPLVAEAQRAFAARRFDEAEKKYQQALRLDEKNVFLLANLATIQLEQNRFSDAEATLKQALAEQPQDAFALSLFGILRFRQEKFDEALEALSQAAKLDPKNAETQNYLGIALSQKGLRDAAETALRKAIQLSPNYPSAHYNLAVVYATQQPPFKELARLHYDKALAAGHPKNPELEKLFAENSTPEQSK